MRIVKHQSFTVSEGVGFVEFNPCASDPVTIGVCEVDPDDAENEWRESISMTRESFGDLASAVEAAAMELSGVTNQAATDGYCMEHVCGLLSPGSDRLTDREALAFTDIAATACQSGYALRAMLIALSERLSSLSEESCDIHEEAANELKALAERVSKAPEMYL